MAAIHVLACLSMFWSPLRGLRDMPDRAARPGDASEHRRDERQRG